MSDQSRGEQCLQFAFDLAVLLAEEFDALLSAFVNARSAEHRHVAGSRYSLLYNALAQLQPSKKERERSPRNSMNRLSVAAFVIQQAPGTIP